MIKKFILLILFVFTQDIHCQENKAVEILFHPIYNFETLQLNHQYNSENQTISFSIFKFYVSHFQFYNDQKLVYNSNKNGFLIDGENPNSLNQKLEIPANCYFDEIRFYFGIDDKTNNDGISDGDLDPSKGMYWTWQTGYINMKLEGKWNKNQDFQFHLGGFLKPFISFQEIDLQSIKNKNSVTIIVDLNKFLDNISLNDTNTIMSPSEKAVELSKLAANMFEIKK